VRKDSKSITQSLETQHGNLKFQNPVRRTIENEIECPRWYDT